MRTPRRLLAVAALAVTMALASGCAGGGDDPAAAGDRVVSGPSTVPIGRAADQIPVAHTPPGGYGTTMPPPVLTGCTEPVPPGAPDLRGMWRAVEVEVGGVPAPDHPQNGHVERIEQCGDRVVVTSGGIVHDMRADGTEAGGVHDVAARDLATPIVVVATFEDGTLVLRPVGADGVEVRRHLDGDQLVWDYVGFTARLRRVGPPDAAPPPDTSRSAA